MGHKVTRRLGVVGSECGCRCSSGGEGQGGHAVEEGTKGWERLRVLIQGRWTIKRRMMERERQWVGRDGSWESRVGHLVPWGWGCCVCSSEKLGQLDVLVLPPPPAPTPSLKH